MSNKIMLIVGVIIVVALGGYYFYKEKVTHSQGEAPLSQPASTTQSTPQDPYSNFNAPSK